MAKTYWGSKPVYCEECGQPFEGVFIDCKTQMGQWGLLCVACHQRFGVGLGLGRGQKYSLTTLERIDG